MTHGGLTVPLVGKLAAVTACTTSFVFSVAHYAQLRSELIRAARELNLLSHGQLATTRLGRQVFYKALWGAFVASVCGIIGSTMPLIASLAIPGLPIAGIALTIALLGILGWFLALSVSGSSVLWAFSLMFGGVIVTAIGIKLDILA